MRRTEIRSGAVCEPFHNALAGDLHLFDGLGRTEKRAQSIEERELLEEEEYVNIMEAARLCRLSDKTVRRAIHAGELAAQYPKKNQCQIAVSDLRAWHQLQGDKAELRIAQLEQRVHVLENLVQQLMKQQKETDVVPIQP